MERVRVRYVLTGACLPAYSGRVVHAIVPLRQPDESPTTVESLKAHFRTNWPADMKELADSIATVPIRVLKTGRVLEDRECLQELLTTAERSTCLVAVDENIGEANDEMQKPSVVMHMVIQKALLPPSEVKPIKEKGKASNASENAASGEGREAGKNSCCSVM